MATHRTDARRDGAFWIIRVAAALIFVSIGVEKFDARPSSEWVAIFARIGLGQWFRVATGICEIAGGAMLLVPYTSRAGATILTATMLGAVVAHLTVLGDPVASILPLVFGAIAVAVGFHEPSYDIRQLTGRRPASPNPKQQP